MLIQSRPNQGISNGAMSVEEVVFTHCTICKVTSAKGKVQLVFETELSNTALLENVKTAVGLSAGLVDITIVERPETGETEKASAKRKH